MIRVDDVLGKHLVSARNVRIGFPADFDNDNKRISDCI